MAIRSYDLTLDTKNDIMPQIVFGRQGDRTGAVVINGTLTDNNVPVDLTDKRLIFKAKTADGTYVVLDSVGFTITDAKNGKFTYQLPNALWSEAGRIKNAYFSLYGADNVAESTFGLVFVVASAVDMTEDQKEDYITIVDQTLQSLTADIGTLQDQVDAITKAYEAGEFYNKSEVDSKVKTVQDEVTANAQSGKVHFGYMSEIIDQLQNGWTAYSPEQTSYRMICTNPAKREALLYINCNGPLGDGTPTIPAYGSTTMFTLKKTVIETLFPPVNAAHNYNAYGNHMISEIHTDTNALGVRSSVDAEITGGDWTISLICLCRYAEGVVFE